MPAASKPPVQVASMLGATLPGFRLVTLCGSIAPLFSGTDDYHHTVSDGLAARGMELVPVDIGNWSLRRIGALAGLVRAARPDAILMQYPTDAFGRSLMLPLFGLLQQVAPLVVTLHEFTAAHPLRKAAVGALLLRASAIITTAQKEADGISAWYPWLRSRNRIIPVGPNTPPRDWQPSAASSVVYFGQIRPEKGIEEFLACHDRLAPRFPGARFTVAGSSVPLFATYADRMREEFAQRGVTFAEGLDSSAIADLLSGAWAALLPFPDGASFRRSSLLAAACSGTPLVTVTGPDTPPDLASLLAPASNTVDDLAAVTERFLSDPEARMEAHRRSQAISAMVGWDAIVDQYLAIFRGLSRRPEGAVVTDGSAPRPGTAGLTAKWDGST